MFATRRLLNLPCRITLFTRNGCGLCSQGKQSLSDTWDKRPFDYVEEDVDAKGSKWRDLYDFDVPVVSLDQFYKIHCEMLITRQIHIAKSEAPAEDVNKASKAVKLMHRFTPQQVMEKMDQVEKI